jgi:hypothetical protein
VNQRNFERALRNALGQIPLETRRAWNGNDLFGWWMEFSAARPGLALDGYEGDLWQRVHGMCRHMHLFGEQSV